MGMDITYLDQEGYKRYLKRIEAVEVKLREIQKAKGEVTEHYDGHNSPFYPLAIEEQMALQQLHELKKGLSKIQIRDTSTNKGVVDIGSVVTIKFDDDDDDDASTYRLVATLPSSDIIDDIIEISINCPMGAAILNHLVGDEVSYKVDNNVFVVKILKIE